ncbi:protein RALF-like 33 [Vitis riparia]|uniref:protein RALF-like 33 n=1 Tax=Vitis riparia TaxID=96939 RepID=UPI00155B1908|nr:protein RALF-like 33 [Vitis riparia]
MRIQLKGVGIYLAFAVLVIVSTAEMERQWESLESSKDHVCNGTISDCIGEQEFLIGFEVKGRSPAQNPHITYRGIQMRPPVCNGNIYGNCIAPKSGYKRPCSYYNRCKRGTR